ncbi:DUF3142 domain-containing protein [Xanthomonas sp. A2111]|uniref:DUF3142 domain-containing protein n=1 Tax=Xanthomonas hawaiiensis TaxID=3003247 RepID=A0ABU2I091_9XANT|nr:DUF3142 domain-containing protein [Xanthomonas sp. A2111]MBO9827955.1 DUF3142 domain-containing protein [Xanthomonas sp. A2111]MDS9991531.1 DUF3142 domain-containing protein [Xanthomonas sp. A2111]
MSLRHALLGLSLLLGGCAASAPAPLEQQVYVWQRQWNGAHAAALAQTRADFAALRVLALQAHPRAGWGRAAVELRQLAADGRPVIAVVRLDGQLPALDAARIDTEVLQLVRRWRAAGVALRGVEIDHDCATARLPAYAALLRQLRGALPAELALSITALPAWLDSPALAPLLRTVDSSVLQVHAVDAPAAGLFDPVQARRWADRYAQRSAKPFWLALPAYGVALVDSADADADPRPLIESEAPLAAPGTRHELRVSPQQLAAFVEALRAHRPPHLAGIVWFRLPLPGDRRAWPLATLQAVVHARPLQAAVQVQASGAGPVYDLTLANNGNAAAAPPQRVVLRGSACEAGDALGEYRLRLTAQAPRFDRTTTSSPLAAGERRALGWVRCRSLHTGAIDVLP